MASKWRVLVEQEYDQKDLEEPQVGGYIWVKDSALQPMLVKVNEILPAEHPRQEGTIIAVPSNQ